MRAWVNNNVSIIAPVVALVSILLVGGAYSDLSARTIQMLNAITIMAVFSIWAYEYIQQRDQMVRRKRRIWLSVEAFLFMSMYTSLDAATSTVVNTTAHAVLLAIPALGMLFATVWHPANDLEVPAERVYPWEPFLARLIHHR